LSCVSLCSDLTCQFMAAAAARKMVEPSHPPHKRRRLLCRRRWALHRPLTSSSTELILSPQLSFPNILVRQARTVTSLITHCLALRAAVVVAYFKQHLAPFPSSCLGRSLGSPPPSGRAGVSQLRVRTRARFREDHCPQLSSGAPEMEATARPAHSYANFEGPL
jgi:hypothetical protein